ncbi:uncharacterized protein LOC109861967 [Pseudomyrmex gracilis]|uniref:uncharacterized protein LOC109861967 n=1 Tax=Pseudomyrmex gracilis TaxID=219809 RepID=UPI000995CE9E|nr:uncharacterized protein LOC109861967 [Pseudomyrmex gracilis]
MSLNMEDVIYCESQDIAVVHTCGICEMIIEEKSIPSHDCVEGYNRFFIDTNFYFYPVTNDNRIVRRSLVDNEEVVLPVEKVTGKNESRFYNKKAKRKTVKSLNYDDEELLILSVQEKRPLWDFTIPLEQRCQRLTKKLWDEVSETLGGKLSGEEAKKKFKNLHDAYRRIIQSENLSSGSARPPPTKKWHHYDSMEFLRDFCLVKKGKVSNIDVNDDDSLNNIDQSINDDDATGNDQLESGASDTQIKRKKNLGQQSSALDRIADSLCQPSTPFALPPAPKYDEIDSSLAVIGWRLRQMNPKKQLHVIQQMMNLTYDILRED